MVLVLGIYCNSVLTTGYELGRHSYSPHFIEGEPEAQKGPWGLLKPQMHLSICGKVTLHSTRPSRSSGLSRHEQDAPFGKLAVCPARAVEGTTAEARLVASGSAQLCGPSLGVLLSG